MRPLQQGIGLVVFLAVCFAAAGLGGAATYPRIEGWYESLAKPAWTPPNWIFGPVWTVLYTFMAIAAWLVWRRQGIAGARVALLLFGVQLTLNVAWSWAFFGLRNPALGFADIVLLLAGIVATLVAFWAKSLWAGLLFLPYLAWCGFAALLNFAIWRMNSM